MVTDMAGKRSKIRLVILEDHQSVIDGYLFRLGLSEKIEVVGTACYGEDFEKLLATQAADVAFLDVNVPATPFNLSPYPLLHVIPRLRQQYPDMALLVISMLTERGLIRAVMEAGASGYILKDDREAIKGLEGIVMQVAGGEIFVSKAAQLQFPEGLDNGQAEPILTPRQLEILSLCSAYPDWSMRRVAQELSVEHSTVRNTLSQAYFRLGVRNLASAVVKARQLGLIAKVGG
jgi:DNA-binding NarL/FixJ family response regulator